MRVLLKVSTILMMSDYEKDFDDFPTENLNKPAESMVGSISRRINRSMDSCKWNHYKNSTIF